MTAEGAHGPGIISLQDAARIERGMSTESLLGVAGDPLFRKSPGSATRPTEVFGQLGLSFDFDVDDELDEIWGYLHTHRGTLKLRRPEFTCVGIRGGLVTGTWRVIQDT